MDNLKGSIKAFNVYHTDAYMIAVKNGFEGTEAEWMKSLEMSPEEVDKAVNDYLTKNPVAIDKTLTVSGQAADAKVTGEAVAALQKKYEENKEAGNTHANNKENPHNVTIEQIGAQKEHIPVAVNLPVGGWSNNSQTVTAEGVTVDNTVFIAPASDGYTEYFECGVFCSAQAENKLTFICTEKPTSNLTVNIVIFD